MDIDVDRLEIVIFLIVQMDKVPHCKCPACGLEDATEVIANQRNLQEEKIPLTMFKNTY